ncbi:MAG TPA: dihydrolipoamide acetyltransferase family protein [Solirubrobacteraceae bacterium]|jgi:pyruvate dehydrogenase E2 component (dihydrolipoamide acetyltransferase)|nr:dihydrolipoamide acetyltransferase family protein [Solirubrobacteraceae bacterium]
MNALTMPRLSDSMQQGTILTWLKASGERVEPGDELVEIETDKATMTYEAEASGLLTIVAAEGETLPVGAVIGSLADATEPPGPAAAAVPAAAGQPQDPANEPVPALAALAVATAGINGHRRDGAAKATPLARRAAELHGVKLAEVAGTGPRGRVTRPDVLRHAGINPEPAVSLPVRRPAEGESEPTPDGLKGEVTIVEPSRLQTVIASRMAESRATIPDFQVQVEVVVDAAIALRAGIAASGVKPPSFNDLIVKATAVALRSHPRANASFRDGQFELYSRINVGIAVAAEDALVVPTIFDADQKSLGAIAEESRRLAERVRDQRITPPELSGGTFTVSNLGMYGMSAITPLINPPQVAILGVGATRSVLARVDGEIVERQLMTLTLSCDHRILHGAEGSQLLSEIGSKLEAPIQLML